MLDPALKINKYLNIIFTLSLRLIDKQNVIDLLFLFSILFQQPSIVGRNGSKLYKLYLYCQHEI